MSPNAERFVQEYLVDLNATQAAIRAGYSPKTAYSQGQRLLKNVEVKKAVAAGQKRIAGKLELSAEKVLANIERLSAKAERAKKFGDALKGQELLGKHLKLFTEKHEHGGIGGGPVQFQISNAEAEH